MKKQEVDNFNNFTLQQLLQQQVNSPKQSQYLKIIIYAKSRLQPCNPNSLKMTLQLFHRYGDLWSSVIERFAINQFKLVFSFCIHDIRTYPAIIQQICKQGGPQHQNLFQATIQNAIDGQLNDKNIPFDDIWEIYLHYIRQWTDKIPHRTLQIIERIQNRLKKDNDFYQKLLDERKKIEFVEYLSPIIRFNQNHFMRKLKLRAFWQQISSTIEYLKFLLDDKGFISVLIQKLRVYPLQSNQPQNKKKDDEKQKQHIVKFLINTCNVSILQQTYIDYAQRISKQLVITNVIDYSKYQQERIDELLNLQNSLIYHIDSDDLPSLIQMLLTNLAKNVPNFLTKFIAQCTQFLLKPDLDEINTSDIILKLCILSKQILVHSLYNEKRLQIQTIIKQLVALSDSKSQIIQIKVLKLMHFFRQMLPQQNFMSYHCTIFRVLKRILTDEINKQNINQNPINQMNQNQFNSYNQFNHMFQPPKSIYTKISWIQCIKILQEQTQIQEESKQIYSQIRRKKYLNQKNKLDLFQQNIFQIADKFIQLIAIQGYCEQQHAIFNIFIHFLSKYPQVSARNTTSLLKALTNQFMSQFYRLNSLNQGLKDHHKLNNIVLCINKVLGQVTQQTYFNCEQQMLPIMNLLKQPHNLQIDSDLINFLHIMINKAQSITPQLNNFIIYCQEALKRSNGSILQIQKVITQLCRRPIVKSVLQEWSGLVQYITQLFCDYITYVIQNDRIKLYDKDWRQTVHFCQLFIQTYHEMFSLNQELGLKLQLITSLLLQKTQITQVTLQLLMTIHHIDSRCKLYPYVPVSNLSLYQEKYSLQLAQITMTDILVKNTRARTFDFSQSNNEIYAFLEEFVNMRNNIKQLKNKNLSSQNDFLPLNKIRVNEYILSSIKQLQKDKLIDAQEWNQLRNKLVNQDYLVNTSYFS